MKSLPAPGTIAWIDLTVPQAAQVRDFYAEIAGWTFQAENMGEYEDYSMIPRGSETPVSGICHQRGVNADIPSQWLIYLVVDDVDGSAARAVELGGRVLAGPRAMGGGRFAVIQDPAGAVCALYRP